MRILTNFKDYYDYGNILHDDYITFDRRSSKVSFLDKEDNFFKNEFKYSFSNKTLSLSDVSSFNRYTNWTLGVLYFCNKVIPFIKKKPKVLEKVEVYYDVDSFLVKHQNDIESTRPAYYFSTKHYIDTINLFFQSDFELKQDLYLKYNTPYFVYEFDYQRDKNSTHLYNFNIELLPKLSDYEFYKQFDGHQAYQEIEMFIGNFLKLKENPMIELTDKDKLLQHGFDPKYGFRKTPSKK